MGLVVWGWAWGEGVQAEEGTKARAALWARDKGASMRMLRQTLAGIARGELGMRLVIWRCAWLEGVQAEEGSEGEGGVGDGGLRG